MNKNTLFTFYLSCGGVEIEVNVVIYTIPYHEMMTVPSFPLGQ